MRKIRIGNDLAVQWSLVAKGTGEPFVVEGKDIRLSLKSIFSTTEIEDFTAQGNKIAWTFKGAEQKQTGIYSLVVSVVDAQGAMVTTDVCQFVELVACSCEADGEDAPNVETESIELTSTLEYVAGGMSEEEVLNLLDGYVPKEEGKGLSSNDYTNDEKEKLAGLENYDDTELRDIIADLDNQVSARREEIMNLEYSKADKSELTELSAEVGGLSEKIENLPSGESSVFEAVYGKTTYNEIVEARNKGKEVLCKYNDRIARIVQVMDNVLIYFEVTVGSDSQRLVCYPNNIWDSLYISNSHKLETLDNGNAQITIAGKTAEVASGTPSGDPMHYMYEAVGAEWNGTGADIERQGVYGDTITHKAGYWYLNELGDITTEEMRTIYVESNPMVRRVNLENAFSGSSIRTNIAIWDANRSTVYGSIALTSSELRGVCQDAQIEIFAFIKGPINKNIQKHMPFSANSLSTAFRNASKLSKIIGCFNCQNPTDYKTFENATMLKEVRLIRLKNSFSFANSPLLSKNSVLFAIQNAEATSAITITLHADAYARLAEDADIVAALAEKTNVSLAK